MSDRDRLQQIRREWNSSQGDVPDEDIGWLLDRLDALGRAMVDLLLAIENGDSCYEDPEILDGYLGHVIPASHPAYERAEALLEALGLEPATDGAGEGSSCTEG